LGHLGIAIAGQVDKDSAVGQAKEIDQLGAARGLRDVGEPGMCGQRIDRAGLAGIGAAGKGDFGAARGGQFARLGDGNLEGGVAKQRHWGRDHVELMGSWYRITCLNRWNCLYLYALSSLS